MTKQEQAEKVARETTKIIGKILGKDWTDFKTASKVDFVNDAIQSALLTFNDERLRVAKEGLKKITRQVPIMGSTGDYRAGQTHALEACREHAQSALELLEKEGE